MSVAEGEETGTTAATMTAGETGTTGGEQYNVENHCDDEGGRKRVPLFMRVLQVYL